MGPGGAGGSGPIWGASSDDMTGKAERGEGRSGERPGAEGWGASRLVGAQRLLPLALLPIPQLGRASPERPPGRAPEKRSS